MADCKLFCKKLCQNWIQYVLWSIGKKCNDNYGWIIFCRFNNLFISMYQTICWVESTEINYLKNYSGSNLFYSNLKFKLYKIVSQI